MNEITLPHHKLDAYRVALELLRLVYDTVIRDAEQRQQARNVAEAAGRWSRADKARVYAIARGEV